MIFYNNNYSDDQPEYTRDYICPECGRTYHSPAELKWYTFTDGETRKQCIYCPFHPDEILDYQRDIDPLNFQN